MYLGLDLGTSGLRALLVDPQGQIVGEASAACARHQPHPGWSEQDPQDWIDACETCIAELRATFPTQFQALKAIGLSGHMHGATLLDAAGQVLRPCIMWNDTRSATQAATLDAMPHVRNISANIVFPGFTAPKLMWVKSHEPEVFAKISKVLLPKDYLRYWLTGTYVSDMSDSAGTAWLDVKNRCWSEELLQASGMRLDQMPDLTEGSDITGSLRPNLLSKWGLKQPVAVAGGGGDNAAAACGVGCMRAGQGFVSLGTSGVVLTAQSDCTPSPERAVHSFCHAVPDTWLQMGVILAATDCLNWLARNLNATPQALAAQLGENVKGPAKSLFLPYLSGERTPHNDSDIRGGFYGLDLSSDQSELTAAVMEGVAFALRDSLEALNAAGDPATRLLAIGGGANSRYWVKTLANVLNVPIDIPAHGAFGAALGAARLAMVADGAGAVSDVMTAPDVHETIDPNADLYPQYHSQFARYRALYPAVKNAMAAP